MKTYLCELQESDKRQIFQNREDPKIDVKIEKQQERREYDSEDTQADEATRERCLSSKNKKLQILQELKPADKKF